DRWRRGVRAASGLYFRHPALRVFRIGSLAGLFALSSSPSRPELLIATRRASTPFVWSTPVGHDWSYFAPLVCLRSVGGRRFYLRLMPVAPDCMPAAGRSATGFLFRGIRSSRRAFFGLARSGGATFATIPFAPSVRESTRWEPWRFRLLCRVGLLAT